MRRIAMTWRDRKRIHVPSVDISENPCCVERRLDDERCLIQLNRNPSLKNPTSADVRRTASFAVENKVGVVEVELVNPRRNRLRSPYSFLGAEVSNRLLAESPFEGIARLSK